MTSRTGKPVTIVDYDPSWPRRFEEERRLILCTCAEDSFVAIEHVGSTAVPGLAAKPIIDIMPGVASLAVAADLIEPLASIGYEYVPEYEAEMPFRRYFRKDVEGWRAFHMHLVETTSEFWERHLLFRDYLRSHPAAARTYDRLKRALASQFGTDRAGYTEAKTEFITGIEARARAETATQS